MTTDERAQAIALANRLLDQPYSDPDDDLRMLSRQLLRLTEELELAQLLDVHAICDQRDYLRGRLQLAEELILDAPIHHFGKDYLAWVARRDTFSIETCEHPKFWRTHGKCGICLRDIPAGEDAT